MGILIAWIFEVGNTHIKTKQLTESYFHSFTTVAIVMFATALLKGKQLHEIESFPTKFKINLNKAEH